MRAVLRCESGRNGSSWSPSLLTTAIAGIPLIRRHLLAYQKAGLTEVELWSDPAQALPDELASEATAAGVTLSILSKEEGSGSREPYLEQRADTLVDPRLVSALVERYREIAEPLVCTDASRDNYPAAERSPYRIGSPQENDFELEETLDEGLSPFGLAVVAPHADEAPRRLRIGRHYWHRLEKKEDRHEATQKVFLATMKPTDGVYARTNRRVSIPISTVLAKTSITPNMVSVATLLLSAIAGAVFTIGSYSTVLLASVLSWFACMFDGVDGELARAKFQTSEFGARLEMVGDYLYYVFIFVGMAVGIYRRTSDPIWLYMGVAVVISVVLTFILISRLKSQQNDRVLKGNWHSYFQGQLGAYRSNPLMSFSRRFAFLATRAALPYYVVIFSLLGLVELLLVCVLVGTQLIWMLSLYATHVAFKREAAAAAARAAEDARGRPVPLLEESS